VHHNDTLTILLNDSSVTNAFEQFNFQDSMSKTVGTWHYSSILPKEKFSYKFHFYTKKPFKYFEILYNFGFSKSDAALTKSIVVENFR